MNTTSLRRIRWLLMFVIAWIIGLYVFEVVQAEFNGTFGVIVAALTVLANMYARKRALAGGGKTLATYFWLYMPVIVFFFVPLAFKIVEFFRSDDNRRWWDHLYTLAPFMLKLGVPVAALLWIYFVLGRGREDKDAPPPPPEPEPKPAA